MRLYVTSDWHNEFQPLCKYGPPTGLDFDVAVVAGDVNVGAQTAADLCFAFGGKPVVYVLGNHEPYNGKTVDEVLGEIKEQVKGTNIHVLENESWEYKGLTFLGTTLWTDLAAFDPPEEGAMVVELRISDYSRIKVGPPPYRELRGSDTLEYHKKAQAWLKKESAALRAKGRPFVIVTHHAPSFQSVASCYQEDRLTTGFASRLDQLVIDSEAKLWVHGHVHNASDYVLGKTRVVVNPLGYPHERTGFRSDLVVEV